MIEKERILYEKRIDLFINRIKTLFYEDEIFMNAEYSRFSGDLPFGKRLRGDFSEIKVGDSWGKNWQRAWFHLQGSVPEKWQGKCVAARVNLGGEALLYSQDGTPVSGLSVHTIWDNSEFRRDRILIAEQAEGGEKVDFWLEATAGQLFGLKLSVEKGDVQPEVYGRYEATVQDLALAVFRKDIWLLYLDSFVLNDQMKALPEKSVRRARILHALNRAIDCFLGDEKTTQQAREFLRPELTKQSSASDLTTYAVGHAHLDTAWLWPIHETIRKCARTFSSQIELLEKYPDYIFGASQPQQYEFVKRYYPALYQKIKEKITAGRWEPLGGMWVEADCNLISGESMVRQILHGKNFFMAEFGVDIKNLWLPDVFGYSAAMPQILRKSGIDSFVTQKLSWNQFNKIPHNSFVWRGIDGSEVVAHFPPEDNYNSDLRPSALIYAQENFREKGSLDEFMTLFGIGDGGHGPTEEIIETGRRQKNLENAPKVQFSHAQEFFDRLAEQKDKLPVWVGELYFELHRGTLTTQAYNKKMNRFMELKLRELEILFSMLPYANYPAKQLDRMWKNVLLHQFHDIIPGSSITPVYADSRKEYEKLQEQAEQLLRQAGGLLLEKKEDRICLVNTLSFTYFRTVQLPASWLRYEVVDQDDHPVPTQDEGEQPVVLVNIPPLSSVTLRKLRKKEEMSPPSTDREFILENEWVRYEFDNSGRIKAAFDKECRKQILPDETFGNLLSLYDDRPAAWDAWDIDIFYENQLIETAQLVSRRWIAGGDVRRGIQQTFKIGASEIIQRIYLTANSKRIDFNTTVDWRENHKMLRVSFPVEVKSDTAAFEIQYGHIRRNTHRNTSWDLAKFEAAGHRYADLSDRDYGAALLNDSKYGYKILDNVIDLNLLRATTMPDPDADRGRHQFTYSFLPHKNELIDSPVLAEAAQLNQPPAVFPGYDGTKLVFPFSLNLETIVLEVVKKAEKEDAAILRLYEPNGREASGQLKIEWENATVFETDLMENNLQPLNVTDGVVTLHFTPFEIKTLKVMK